MIEPLLALDVGSTKVACAVGIPRGRAPGFELLGASLIAYPTAPDGWLSDPLTVGQAIEQAVDATGVGGGHSRALVTFSHPALASEQIRCAVTLGDEPVAIRAQDLQRLEARALDHALAADREPLVVVRLGCSGNGFEGVKDPRGLPATRLIGWFHIVTMPAAARRALVQAVESAGFEVAQVTLGLVAAHADAAHGGDTPRRTLVIDAGGLSIQVGCFCDGALARLEVLPWGGLSIAGEIAKELRVTTEQATTWSLEGDACRKADVRSLIEQRRRLLGEGIERLLGDQPRPERLLLFGRAALADGFAEWLEARSGVRTVLCRSERASRLGDVAGQVGLSQAIGLLELATSTQGPPSANGHRLVDRLIHRTRTLLTEYF